VPLSNIFPSVVQPVYVTLTVERGAGRELLNPIWRTFEARPDGVLSASGGGPATSGGAGTSCDSSFNVQAPASNRAMADISASGRIAPWSVTTACEIKARVRHTRR
jgi:hypothetical protein